mgnify:CR=1 FL=1|jgi:hypothetical protein
MSSVQTANIYLAKVSDYLESKARKPLGFATPTEVFFGQSFVEILHIKVEPTIIYDDV